MSIHPSRMRARRLTVVFGLTISLVAGLVAGLPPAVAAAVEPGSPDRSVPVSSVLPRAEPLPKMEEHRPGQVVWPTPGSVVVDLPVVNGVRSAASARVGGLPVKVSPVVSADELSGLRVGGPLEPVPARVRIEVLDRAVSQRGGVPVAFKLSRADGGSGPAKVRVEVDYSGFRQAFGGAYASRLGLRLLPECGLTAVPREQALNGACAGVFLDSVNDFRSGIVAADVDLNTPLAVLVAKPLSAREQAMIGAESPAGAQAAVSAPQESMVVTLSASGDAQGVGTFGKTDLKESGAWSHSGASGNFSYNYPLTTPPVPGSLSPKLSLDYSSATVDGQTAAEHLQNGPLGEGWSLAGGGFIESTFRPCASDNSADHPATWPNATGDPCWRYENFQLSWSGRSGELVPTGTANVWKVAADDVARVEQVVASGHWKITTTDGTQWFFGMQRLPGWTSGARETGSVLTQEMFANHSGEPCFHSSNYAYSHCTKAYRWLLDYVVDTHGNSMSYWYSRFSNVAGSNNSGQSTFSYDRDAVLDRIEYGTRAGNETTATPPAKIEFTNSDRCVAADCNPNVNWPDTPWDLKCDAAPCNNNLSPSYWTTKRLTKITTKVWTGSGTNYMPVDEWAFGQSFPGGTDVPTLWLDSVTRKGFDAAGVSITMPSLTTHGRRDRNRADYNPGASMADPQKYRIDFLDTEAGGRIQVSYLPTNEPGDACTWWSGKSEAQWPNYNHNASRCFMQWTTNRQAPPEWSWWHKFVVDKITETDLVGGSPDKVTSYQYTMDGATSNHSLVLWGYSSSVWASPKKAMSSWKGYPTVITTVGAAGGIQSKTKRVYYRGLDRDTGLDFSQEFWRTSNVHDSEGGSATDHAALGGQVREEIVYDGASGPELSKTIHTPSVIATTAGGALPSWQTPPERYAYLTRNTSKKTFTKIADGSWRTTETVSAWNATYGTLTQTDDLGQTSPVLDTDDVCTKYSYAVNTTNHLINYPYKVESFASKCATATAQKVLTSTQTYYDNGALGAAPTVGNVTTTEQLKYTVCAPIRGCYSITYHYLTESIKAFDIWGRVTSARDALNQETTTVYTHNSAGLLSSARVTTPSPMAGGVGHEATTTYDVLRGLPVTATDPNGKITTGAYDPLGRMVAVRQPGNTGTYPDVAYVYMITKTSAPYIETKALGPNGNQISSFEIFDGLLRQRQTQAVTEDGKRAIADTRYDDRGLVTKSSIFYNAASAPNSTLVWPANGDGDIDRQTRFVYDSAGRKTKDQLYKNNTWQFETTTVYEGDRTGVIPPAGGTVTQDLFDARGGVAEKRQFSGADFTTAFDRTIYTYDRLGRLTKVTDPAGNQWTYQYDLLSRKTKTTDPDTGTDTASYDDAGQIIETVNGNGNKLAYKYDGLGRKTEVREDTLTGTVLASWLYDTVAKGQLSSSSRHDGGNTYTSTIGSYDDGYRPLSATSTIPGFGPSGGVLTYNTTSEYKQNGALYKQILPGAGGLPEETITHSYDDNGFAQTMVGSWTGGSQTYVADTAYKYDGLVSAQLLGGQGKQVRLFNSYFADTRRLSLSGVDIETATLGTFATKYSTDYAYDNAGNITYAAGMTDSIRDQVECFNYDHLRRMKEGWTQATIGSGCITPQRAGADPYWRQWTFDAIGNRLTQKDIDNTTGNTDWTYQVGAAGGVKPHHVKKVDATGPLAATATRTFGYDTGGNTTSRTTETGTAQTLTWDKEGHLATVKEGTNTIASYVYDNSGNRLIANTTNKSTLYLPDGTELEKIGGADPLGTRYYSGIAVRNAAGLKWICSNHQGTSTAQIDAVTLTPDRRRFMPYGETPGTSPAWTGTKTFVGGTQDNTGLTHIGAREYDPTLGRFISRDPVMDLTDPQQIHGYAYSHNNPTTFSDPTGLYNTCDNDGGTCAPRPPEPQDESTSSSGSGNGSTWKQPTTVASTGMTPLEATYAIWAALGQPMCFGGAAGGGTGFCDDFRAWLPQIVQYSTSAGIDPQLLFAIMAIEVNASQDCVPCQNLLDFGSWALDNLGVYGGLKDTLTGKGSTPPSLGWGNMKADIFYDTVNNHPSEFAGVEWTDVMDNPELSIKLAAYRLADLAKIADQTATPLMRQQYTRNQVIAAMYNTYPGGYESALHEHGTLGPMGSTYARTAAGHMQTGQTLICNSGVWSCS